MRRRLLSLLLMLCLLLSLCACTRSKADSALLLYSPAVASDDLSTRAITTRDYSGPAGIEGLMSALLLNLFSGEVRLVDWSHTGDTVHLVLSREYTRLSGIDLTLAESSIVLTLCQLDGISRVQISLAGTPGTIYSSRRAEDMIFTGAEEEPREIPVELYFPRSGGRGLGFESRTLVLTQDDDLYAAVTEALLAGPESAGLKAPFPEGLKVLGSRLESGVCHVNFSSHLLEAEVSASERDLLLYSIVDTLGNLDAVSSVQVLVEGEPLSLYGNTDTSLPLVPDFGLLAD